MNFLFAYAGIPAEIYDEFSPKRRANITGSECEFISKPLALKDERRKYSLSDSNYYIKKFYERLKADHYNTLANTGFAIFYIRHENGERFADSFFPHILSIEIDWNLEGSTKKELRNSANKLEESLRNATNEAKAALRALKKTLTEADSQTSLLLPIRNFDSKHLVPSVKQLQRDLIEGRSEKFDLIKRHENKFAHHHPKKQPEDNRYKYLCYVDKKHIEFNPPGKARHGYSRGSEGHPETCFIGSRRRLGVQYDSAFHYDCVRGTGNLVATLSGCHTEPESKEGNPHLNISPNDHVR